MERAYDEAGQPGWERCTRTDLAALLPRWDELEPAQRRELEEHALVCPSCGPALATLASADRWLRAQAAAAAHAATEECPPAEELYDYGRGPGARPLPDARRAALDAHVAVCFDCEALVGTLASRPPVPLVLDPLDPLEKGGAAPRRRSRLRLVAPALAAAAAVVAAFFVWSESMAGGPDGGLRFPGEPLLRGEESPRLWFPRDQLLATAAGVPWSDVVFEIAPEAGAERYRVYVGRHAGGAFDQGERIAALESDGPVVAAPPGLAAELVPGHYTWEAWAVVDGLDIALGRRDFEVVRDDELLARLAALDPADPQEAQRALELLHARHPTDARAFARTLPPSPEREAYLERVPAR